MKDVSVRVLLGLIAVLLAGNLLSAPTRAQSVQGVALAPANPAAVWVMVGNKVYYVEKDSTTILKVSASGTF